MDPGTAIAVLAVIKPTAQTILDAWQDARNYGGDIRGLSVRFSASKAYLSHYENLLFTKDKLPGIQGTLYETLLETDRRTILDMLGELQLLLNAYVATNRKYELESTRTADDADLDQSKETRNAVILSTAISKDEEQAKLVGWVKKTWCRSSSLSSCVSPVTKASSHQSATVNQLTSRPSKRNFQPESWLPIEVLSWNLPAPIESTALTRSALSLFLCRNDSMITLPVIPAVLELVCTAKR